MKIDKKYFQENYLETFVASNLATIRDIILSSQ